MAISGKKMRGTADKGVSFAPFGMASESRPLVPPLLLFRFLYCKFIFLSPGTPSLLGRIS